MRPTYQTVSEIMRTKVTTVREDTPVRDLARLLVRERISGVPVVDGDDRVIGVASATDILRLAAHEPTADLAPLEPLPREPGGGEAKEAYYVEPCGDAEGLGPLVLSLVPPRWMDSRSVGDIMSRTCHSVRRKTTLSDLARLLLRLRIHRAMVIEEGKLVGIVTAFDVMRAMVGRSETFERDF